MKSREMYELNILGMIAMLLMRWRLILMMAILAGLLAVFLNLWVIPSQEIDKLEYHQISAAITERKQEELNLYLAEKRLWENPYYGMGPEEILTKRLTVAVILEDQSLVHDQADPADLVLYGYYDLALSQLQGEVLVPEVLTKVQQERLLEIVLDERKNILTISMTSDDGMLIDRVLSIAAQWCEEKQGELAEQTFSHRLEFLPVTELCYTQEERERLVSSAEAELEIRTLELNIAERNQTIENLFLKDVGWAASRSVEELEAALLEKWEKESRSSVLRTAVGGALVGAVLAILWICVPIVVKGKALGESGIQSATGWNYIGRIFALPKPGDPVSGKGVHMLYERPYADETVLHHEIREMTALLLKDRGMEMSASIALIGNVPERALEETKKCLDMQYPNTQTALLCGNRVQANRLCREAEAVIFVGSRDTVTTAEAELLWLMLEPLEKKPLGYILV